jgi:isopenicillin N synthase-like dioxygenase
VNGLTQAMDSFFQQPLAEKKKYQLPPTINRGYSPPKSEVLSRSIGVESANGTYDFFEAFNIGSAASDYPGLDLSPDEYPENVWPDLVSFHDQVTAYYREARRVAHTVTAIFADALGIDPQFFAMMSDHSVDVLRMNNFALPEGTDAMEDDATGMGAHTDFGVVTVLWADQIPGLQILGPDHVWHDVTPADGALLLNLGDIAARLTNDRWRSTLHRVKPPVVNGTIKQRRSTAFFHDGNIDYLITPLPSCITPGETPAYEPITVRENLKAKLGGSQQGNSNHAAVREAARVLAANHTQLPANQP